MKIIPLKLPGAFVIEPVVHRDERGFFLEAFHAARYAAAGVNVAFVQDNHSRSAKNVLRGLHGQLSHPQGKLVRALAGKILDVIVDVRVGSPMFGKWESVELSSDNARQIWVPEGFLHGLIVLSEIADMEYKCTDYYDPKDEIGVLWNDPEIGIAWPVEKPILSARDQAHPPLRHWMNRLPRFMSPIVK